MKTAFKYIALFFTVLISLLLIAGQILNATVTHIPPPGKMIDVGGHKLHINCTGVKSERPTIILEAGLGNASGELYWYQAELEKTEYVCSYDRAGTGWSELSNIAADSENISSQLHILLDKSNIKPPYVFASHSVGAIHSRLYAHKYPDEIAGMVFIDGSHPEQYAKYLAIDPEVVGPEAFNEMLSTIENIGTIAQLGLFRLYNPFELPEDIFPVKVMEGIKYYKSKPNDFVGFHAEAQARFINPLQTLTKQKLGDTPLTVVTTPFDALSRFDGEQPTDTDKKIAKVHEELQHQTLLSSTKSKMVIIDESSHMSLIFKKEHALQVVSHIIDMVDQVIAPN